MRCTENCKTWSWHWSIEWAQFFSTATPDYLLHNQCLKSWMNWASKFCLIYHMHQTCDQPTTTSSILTLFTGKMHPQPARCTKMLSKSSWILKHRFLHYKNKQTFLVVRNVLIVMVPILIRKDVFESSCNDLKFMVQSYNYFFSNPIECLCCHISCSFQRTLKKWLSYSNSLSRNDLLISDIYLCR